MSSEFIVTPKRLSAPGEGLHLLSPVIVDRRKPAHITGLPRLVMCAEAAFMTLFAAATLGWIESPMPRTGRIAETVPPMAWAALLALTLSWKAVSETHPHRCRRPAWCRWGAMLGFSTWLAFTAAVWWPLAPVMSWVFGPLMCALEAKLYRYYCPLCGGNGHGNGKK